MGLHQSHAVCILSVDAAASTPKLTVACFGFSFCAGRELGFPTSAVAATLREGILGTARAVPSRRSGAGPADGRGSASRHACAAVGLAVRLEHVLDHVHDLRRSPPSLSALAQCVPDQATDSVGQPDCLRRGRAARVAVLQLLFRLKPAAAAGGVDTSAFLLQSACQSRRYTRASPGRGMQGSEVCWVFTVLAS